MFYVYILRSVARPEIYIGATSDLKGRFAAVTGGAQGIGRAIVERLLASGAAVAIWDRDEPLARKTAGELKGRVEVVPVDVTDFASVERARDATVKAFGRIDILVNNAALYAKLSPRNFNEWDAEVWDRVMAINVRGPYFMVRHVSPHMIAQKSGKIINIASGAAYKGVPRMLPYVTSKGAMLAFTRALSRELGPHGIAVNSLSPGYILSDTGLENATHVEEERMPVRNSRAFKRDGYPEDLVGALVFLASSDSDFVTGQSLVVDGGSVNN